MKELQESIIKMVEEKGDISFVEIEELFEKKELIYLGDYVIMVPGYEHMVIWGNWKMEFIDLISKMCSEKLIEMEPCSPLVYMVDGRVLNMPLVKEVYQYKTDHWQPIVFIKPGTSKL